VKEGEGNGIGKPIGAGNGIVKPTLRGGEGNGIVKPTGSGVYPGVQSVRKRRINNEVRSLCLPVLGQSISISCSSGVTNRDGQEPE